METCSLLLLPDQLHRWKHFISKATSLLSATSHFKAHMGTRMAHLSLFLVTWAAAGIAPSFQSFDLCIEIKFPDIRKPELKQTNQKRTKSPPPKPQPLQIYLHCHWVAQKKMHYYPSYTWSFISPWILEHHLISSNLHSGSTLHSSYRHVILTIEGICQCEWNFEKWEKMTRCPSNTFNRCKSSTIR